LIVGIVITAVIFLTELTSNTATTATLVPVLAALATGLGLLPTQLVIPAALAASCAFMLPVATPPNAIVYGSGEVPLQQMIRAGIWLNLIGILIITLLAALLLS
jgi:sodium-dependent dicarboxylate transporter 2/3/5